MRLVGAAIRIWQKAPLRWRQAFVASPMAPFLRRMFKRAYAEELQVFELTAPLEGNRMRLHWQTQKAFVFGTFEPDVAHTIQEYVRPGWHVLDIGAHIGYHTLLLSRKVGKEGRVIAFEPWPENFRVLAENVRLNGCGNVALVNKAVLAHTGRVHFGKDNEDPLSSVPSVRSEGVEVECVSFDDFRKESLPGGPVHFIKIDAEGAELAILEGMRNFLKEASPLLLVELHGFGKLGEAHPALCFLREAGFLVDYVGTPGEQAHILAHRSTESPEPRR